MVCTRQDEKRGTWLETCRGLLHWVTCRKSLVASEFGLMVYWISMDFHHFSMYLSAIWDWGTAWTAWIASISVVHIPKNFHNFHNLDFLHQRWRMLLSSDPRPWSSLSSPRPFLSPGGSCSIDSRWDVFASWSWAKNEPGGISWFFQRLRMYFPR